MALEFKRGSYITQYWLWTLNNVLESRKSSLVPSWTGLGLVPGTALFKLKRSWAAPGKGSQVERVGMGKLLYVNQMDVGSQSASCGRLGKGSKLSGRASAWHAHSPQHLLVKVLKWKGMGRT